MLDIHNLAFAYNAGSPDEIVALHDVTLQIAPGELVAIIGHNGSGKSTLAKILCAILSPTGGSFRVDGIPATAANEWEIRRRVGMVFQRPDDQLIANTVIDDVAFGPENLGLPRSEIEKRVRESLAALGMADRAYAQVAELSGGEKQRVAIASVLAMRPNYLILDEPTTMVAPTVARQVLRLAHDVRDRFGVAVLHITHFMYEVVGFDRVVVMGSGRVLMHGSPRAIFARADELHAAGLALPQVTELGRRLYARGVDLPPVVLSAEELRAALSQFELRHAPAEIQPAPEPDPTPDPQPELLLQARDINFTYMAGTPLAEVALRGANCDLYAGETVALLGGTQAGKSTLIEFLPGCAGRNPASYAGKGKTWAQQTPISAGCDAKLGSCSSNRKHNFSKILSARMCRSRRASRICRRPNHGRLSRHA